MSLEAANRLLHFLVSQFSNSPALKSTIADRLVGYFGVRAVGRNTWEPAEVELTRALEFDDSLFVVEEPNLFIDEVRETKRWVEVFEALEWNDTDEEVIKLLAWVRDGVSHMGKLVETEDGPLGWASNPTVFAVGIRLIRCSAALSNKVKCKELEQVVAMTKAALRSNHTRVSKLLTESWINV